jgi:hypothetical protein
MRVVGIYATTRENWIVARTLVPDRIAVNVLCLRVMGHVEIDPHLFTLCFSWVQPKHLFSFE